ncbi:acyl-CoA thioesterase [Acinetobacter wanghuae]|uniref:Acyl-CoA thioesterase n=1 Tax=Acinetobacter wanghuae TaxID=2662362 RepID=A0A5Q0P0Q0_9GAMM|nr:thioesterase family protein [Acinetobacter wanghuae]MQW93275.1 acyl-CoA thioesterase [Acinetobacter wanghuae]QGA10103.1 acyl-CoA thioesterase [Acinetobacter wanghuae]
MFELTQYPIVYDQKIAWGDMDAFGHVNNVIFHRYIESARLAYLDQLDILSEPLLTVVLSNQCHYLKPVVYPDQLKVGVKVEEIRNSAFRMKYTLYSEEQKSIVANAEAVIVCVDKTSMQKIKIPEYIVDKIKQLEQSVNNVL